MRELIRIPVQSDVHQQLKDFAKAKGYKSLSRYLRDIMKRETGIDTEAGLKSWGGDRGKEG